MDGQTNTPHYTRGSQGSEGAETKVFASISITFQLHIVLDWSCSFFMQFCTKRPRRYENNWIKISHINKKHKVVLLQRGRRLLSQVLHHIKWTWLLQDLKHEWFTLNCIKCLSVALCSPDYVYNSDFTISLIFATNYSLLALIGQLL